MVTSQQQRVKQPMFSLQLNRNIFSGFKTVNLFFSSGLNFFVMFFPLINFFDTVTDDLAAEGVFVDSKLFGNQEYQTYFITDQKSEPAKEQNE